MKVRSAHRIMFPALCIPTILLSRESASAMVPEMIKHPEGVTVISFISSCTILNDKRYFILIIKEIYFRLIKSDLDIHFFVLFYTPVSPVITEPRLDYKLLFGQVNIFRVRFYLLEFFEAETVNITAEIHTIRAVY